MTESTVETSAQLGITSSRPWIKYTRMCYERGLGEAHDHDNLTRVGPGEGLSQFYTIQKKKFDNFDNDNLYLYMTVNCHTN